MKIKSKLTGIIFLLTIFSMLLRFIVIYFPLANKFLQRSSRPEPAFDALAAYPYVDADAADEDGLANTESMASHAYAVFDELKGLITEYMGPNSAYFMDFVIGKRLVDQAMGLDMTASLTAGEEGQDVVAIWRDDYLGYVVHDADNTLLIESIVDFGKQMQKEGRNFLYLVVPSKQTQTIAYLDYSEKLRQQLLQMLRDQGLDTIDFMEVIEERQLDMRGLFFKTDHHWLPSTGIWADQILCEFMNDSYGYRIDTSVFDPENYDTIIFPDSFLGSQGRKVTTVYCEKEDFPVVMPKYDTDLEVFISLTNRTYTGSIQDTLFDYESLEAGISDIYGRDAYNFYGYGNRALITTHNNDINDGSRVLVIKTSDANVMVPYLSAVLEDLYVIDLRRFNGSLRTFINETAPDTVIVVADAVNLEGFDFLL